MGKKDKKKRRFVGKVSRNAAKQARGTQYGHLNLPKGISIFKEEAGSRASLDIMPYVVSDPNHPDRDDEYEVAIPGELWYRRPYKLHRNIGANNESVICPTSIGQSCPICEHRAQLLKEGADWDDDAVKALKSSPRNLYVVIPKGSKKYDEKVHVWDIAQYLFQNKLNEEIQEDEQFETFPDLEEGFTLRVRFSEEQLGNNKFADTSRIDFLEREEPYDESILDEIPCLDEIIEIPSYKAVEALFFGGLSRDGDDEDEPEERGEEEEKPRQLSRGRREPEPEDEPEDEPEEEEEEKPKPSRNRRSRRDEVEDEDEPEEEEEEKPRKTGKKPPEKPAEKKGKSSSKDECPHGHRFGKDNDSYDECDECEVWERCMDAADSKK